MAGPAPKASGAKPAVSTAEPSRRERRRREVRDRILEVGRALFDEHGYEAATVEEIARGADIAYGTFFNHFPSKLELLRALAHETMRELFAEVDGIRERPGSFADHLVAVFEVAAERTLEKGSAARELIGAMMAQSFPETAVDDDRLMRELFRGFLEGGLAAGEVRDDVELEVLNEVFVGAWYSMFLSWVHFEEYPLRERASATGRFLAQTFTAVKEK